MAGGYTYYLKEKIESRPVTRNRDGYEYDVIYIIMAYGSGVENPPVNPTETIDPIDVLSWLQSVQGIFVGLPSPYYSDCEVSRIRIQVESPDMVSAVVTFTPPSAGYESRENQYGEIWEWDYNSQTTHITSVRTASLQISYPPALDPGTAIGIDSDSIKGVDVYRPLGGLKVSKRILRVNMNSSYRRTLMNGVAKTNSNSWFDWSAGELLFQGASISPRSKTEYDVTFNFLFGERQINVPIQLLGGSYVYVTMSPWQYLWFRHREIISPTSYKYTGIESVHLATVYDSFNFSTLGIQGP